MYRWEITEDAACDVEEIGRYVYSYSGSHARADAVIDGIVALFDRICVAPLLHAVYQFPEGLEPAHEYRSANAGRYKVFYRVDETRETVLIYRVRHVVSDFTRLGM